LAELADCDDPDEARRLRGEIIVNNMELARRQAYRYVNRGVPADDLVQVAHLALVKAVAAFDPLRAETFLSFVVLTVRGELKKHFRDHAWAIKPPRRLQELQLALKAELPTMAQEIGEVPSDRALADRLNAPEGEVGEAMGLSGFFAPTSLDRPQVPGHDDSLTLAEQIPAGDTSMDCVEIRMLLQPMLADLTLRERRIVHLRFYCEWTQAKIAAEMGVTQMQISRILKQVLTTLRSTLERQLAAG
jgi:RNA polymerase sigma-B factor